MQVNAGIGIGNGEPGGHQYLTFILADEEYGVEILQVQEIRGWTKTTPIPNAPSYMKGVINLRGSIVPIIDLRERFHLPPLEYGPTTVVIVVRFHDERDADQRDMGIVVDAVSEVYTVDRQTVKAAPKLGGPVGDQFVNGIAMINEKMIILLNVDRLKGAAPLVSNESGTTSKRESQL
ncbi:chemotaxis protein CheW [Kineobactrum sediminis]|uniref:Chemotaxis protein CheW n=2 Tax=Kineobactrum sediminis TaxID=1905677 RepID=A0A2N5Y7U8_9GAMM|nr:chemotaxis protein CheW [Kineobactrum sediminis]